MSHSKVTSVVLGVSGSIAAYKAVELTRLMIKAGWAVHVIMTAAATRFVTPLTFRTLSRNPVGVDAFAEPEAWMPGHISLAERADIVVVAPCTANVLAKMTHGLSDDLLCATLLATRAPLVIAPSMNTGMWDNPITQANLAAVRARGVHIVDAGTGDLACGSGKGRMADPEAIMALAQRTVATASGT